MSKVRLHLERVGGMVVHPLGTLDRLSSTREGSLLELLPWAFVAVLTAAPIEAGRAFLLFRVGLFDGLPALLTLFANRVLGDLLGVLGLAALFFVLEQLRPGERRGFDRWVDVLGFLLVPHYLVLSVSSGAAMLLGDAWWLPHHSLKGVPQVFLLRLTGAYLWSAALAALFLVRFLRRAPA